MFRSLFSVTLLLFLAGCSIPAWAHSMNQGAVLLDFHGATANVELQLPVERLKAALGAELSPENKRIADYILRKFSASLPGGESFRVDPLDFPHWASIDGAPYVVMHLRLTPPSGNRADLFDLHCNVLLEHLPDQVFLVSIRTDWQTSIFANDPQLIAVLHGNERSVRIDRRDGDWRRGLASLFKLGMRHIAEGTDHLLFLLTLLLPAPLLVRRARWSDCASTRRCLMQIGKIVTAFTLGHSVTLAAGALNVLHVPSHPIEVLIAVSILVSAAHALRPLFPGREAVIAGCFGLIHGMAFATTLSELGLARWDRAASVFGFNLGIEAMQLIVVAAALPSLILLSRTVLYPAIRIGGALLAGSAATAWIVQRLWNLPNPADPFVLALAEHALWIAAALTLLGVLAQRAPTLNTPAASQPILNE